MNPGEKNFWGLARNIKNKLILKFLSPINRDLSDMLNGQTSGFLLSIPTRFRFLMSVRNARPRIKRLSF